MLERINIISIITDHFKTLKSLNQKSNWVNGKDLLLFIGFPLTISALLYLLLHSSIDSNRNDIIANYN